MGMPLGPGQPLRSQCQVMAHSNTDTTVADVSSQAVHAQPLLPTSIMSDIIGSRHAAMQALCGAIVIADAVHLSAG